jgi:hypothetical protein
MEKMFAQRGRQLAVAAGDGATSVIPQRKQEPDKSVIRLPFALV